MTPDEIADAKKRASTPTRSEWLALIAALEEAQREAREQAEAKEAAYQKVYTVARERDEAREVANSATATLDAVSEQRDALLVRVEQAERAVAELKATLVRAHACATYDEATNTCDGCFISEALTSTTLGQGYLSPEQAKAWAEKVKAACARIADDCDLSRPAMVNGPLKDEWEAGVADASVSIEEAILAFDVDKVKP